MDGFIRVLHSARRLRPRGRAACRHASLGLTLPSSRRVGVVPERGVPERVRESVEREFRLLVLRRRGSLLKVRF